MTKISFITIGTELLKGRIVNTNAAEAGLLLRRVGYQLHRVLSIADTREAILEATEEESQKSQVVLISGGLGPTKDDITKHTLAQWMGQELVWHAPTLAQLEERYAKRGRTLNRLTRAQALVPNGCEVIRNRKGTAPGMCFQKGDTLIFSMPGVPFEMLYMLEHEVIPKIQQHFDIGTFQHRVLRLANIPESKAAERMESIEANLPPSIDIAYLPRADGLWLELSLQLAGKQEALAEVILDQASDQVAELFVDKLYTIGEQSLSQLIVEFFHAHELTLGLLEQVSGGGVAAKLLEVSKSADILETSLILPKLDQGNRVELDMDIYIPKGLEDQEKAKSLAKQLREYLKVDVGLAIIGRLEAEQGKQAEVWIGFADERGGETLHMPLLYDRKINQDRVIHYALQFCLKIAREHFA